MRVAGKHSLQIAAAFKRQNREFARNFITFYTCHRTATGNAVRGAP